MAPPKAPSLPPYNRLLCQHLLRMLIRQNLIITALCRIIIDRIIIIGLEAATQYPLPKLPELIRCETRFRPDGLLPGRYDCLLAVGSCHSAAILFKDNGLNEHDMSASKDLGSG